MVEFTIETTSWDNVKLFWDKWKNYDISVQTYGMNIEGKVYINTNVYEYEQCKTLGFYKNGILMNCGQVIDFGTKQGEKVVGIANMCTDPAYRNNGIGTDIMKVMAQYIKNNDFSLSILYPSLYSKLIEFYERFGYEDYKKVMLYCPLGNPLPHEKLDEIIKNIGKF